MVSFGHLPLDSALKLTFTSTGSESHDDSTSHLLTKSLASTRSKDEDGVDDEREDVDGSSTKLGNERRPEEHGDTLSESSACQEVGTRWREDAKVGTELKNSD